ncbi:ABC-type spermidine/putrescine transport system, permease component I [Rubellimicrobium thermophilum DSM 16684]|uniref:ABC-type spermidine/putrescine transport system, permease component I n=1 Tax=Rubellimicrobium thermophilum DSM 16684 TaxID=1123069 RepID=S9S7Q2_9RHOB|nr:ABC transporter permease [Rubellimicrobium thermophilum]EPX86215.1 ABC-type spermidine/putrescine transport system, permease component I [Rubellimicrobium thermophilum DSM 16684]
MAIFESSPRARAAALAAPPFLYAVLLLALPLVTVVAVSFMTQQGVGLDLTPTLANYREIFTSPVYIWGNAQRWGVLPVSLFVAGMVTLITVVLAFPIAYFVSFHVDPGRKSLWLFLITIPFWTSYLIRIFLWKVILGFNGVVNTALQAAGVIEEPLQVLLYNLSSVIIALSHSYIVFAVLPIYVALEKIDRSLLEAAQDLGENRVTTFLRVTLPLAVPGIVGAVLIVFIPVIGDYVTPELMLGAGGRLMANMIQAQFLQLNNWPLGAALALVTMTVVVLVALLFVAINRRWLRGRS